MRVVAGSLRGRRLVAPAGRDTRPTSDRVREAMFNALASLDLLHDADVIDLFAGSGALGIEALSRGASHCTFVEHARPALAALRANIATLGLAEASTVVPMTVERYLAAPRPKADLALVDPPYEFGGWNDLLDAVPAHFVVAETAAPLEPPHGWQVVRGRGYGRTVVTFLERADAANPE
jgi:16S rRNA (guanine966-N2)-methyltransferase